MALHCLTHNTYTVLALPLAKIHEVTGAVPDAMSWSGGTTARKRHNALVTAHGYNAGTYFNKD